MKTPTETQPDPNQTSTRVSEILETLVPAHLSRTIQPPPSTNWNDKRENDKNAWLDKWLPMNRHCPQLQILADEVHTTAGRIFYKHKRGDGKILLIYGSNGSGKTHAAKCLYRWFNHVRMSIGPVPSIDEEGTENLLIPDATMVNWVETVANFKKGEWNIIDRLINDYLVILDDIGAEHDPSGIASEKLYLILSKREFKHTIITTNIPPSKFPDRFEQRIASRLFRNTIDVDLSDVQDFSTRID